jgi:signal transduction histidine kinase
MTGTLGDTLSFEKVIESALDVATNTMAEWDPQGSQVGMVFLFTEGGRMRLAAARNLPRYESGQGIAGQEGIVARCLENAEIVVRRSPFQDPELHAYTGISNCLVAAAVPLRAGLENYGAMVFATSAFDMYKQEQLDLFTALASRAALALSNALLYENLQVEKDRIVAIENEAKRRLSRDLHDGPTQSVSAIAMRLNFMRKALLDKPDRLTKELELVEQLALQTVSEIRHMLFTLRPLVLETQGLVPALRALVEKTQQMAPLNIRIREMGDGAKLLDNNQSAVIFHVVEEALGNARKYSEAKLIEIRLWTEDNLFVAQIADNGIGFNVDEVLGNYESRGSLGMVNMRERAALVDGSLDVQSTPGKGTKITLVVPRARRIV